MTHLSYLNKDTFGQCYVHVTQCIKQICQYISDTKSISDFIMLVYKISKTTTKIYFKIMIVKFTHQRVRFSV